MIGRPLVALVGCTLFPFWAGAQTPSDPPTPPSDEAASPPADSAAETDDSDEKEVPPPPQLPEPAPPPATDPSAAPNEQKPGAAQPFDTPTGDISLDDWERDDWVLLKPSVSLLELNGYFRLRGDLFRKMDFDNATGWESVVGSGSESSAADTEPRYDQSPTGEANYASTNMRLRLEPQINVTDRIQIVTTIDVLDNLILGSTPETIPPTTTGSPVNLLSRTQGSPENGVNALTDSIKVKRAYARLTALNEQLELKFGRMPNHWGLGMMTNSGDCLDCDYGDVADRVALTFRAAGHLFSPMYDWVSSGPMITPFGRSGGQPIDAIDRDDVVQYSLRVERIDHPADIRERVSEGESVVNYGIWNIIRTQKRDLDRTYYEPGTYDPAADIDSTQIEKRDAFLYTVNAYGRLLLGDFQLAAEAAFVWGYFKDTVVDATGSSLKKTDVYKLGGALEGSWQLPGQRYGSALKLKAGGASGDSKAGFGTLDRADTQRGQDGPRQDQSLNNFQFSPDYHVDLLMFRRIIGTVSDAWYVRPGVTYLFDDNFAGSLAAVYSQAIFRRTTPGGALPMGLEFDAELSYGVESLDKGPFGAALLGGIAFPFGAFDNLDPGLSADEQGGSFAWTVQARLYVNF